MTGWKRRSFDGVESLGGHALIVVGSALLQFLVHFDGTAASAWLVPVFALIGNAIQWNRFTRSRLNNSSDPTFPEPTWTHDGVSIRWRLSPIARASRRELAVAGLLGFTLLIASSPLGATSTPSYAVRNAGIFWAIAWSLFALVWVRAVLPVLLGGGDVELEVGRHVVRVVEGRTELELPIAGLQVVRTSCSVARRRVAARTGSGRESPHSSEARAKVGNEPGIPGRTVRGQWRTDGWNDRTHAARLPCARRGRPRHP